MSPNELITQHKVYSEDLEKWVVPLEVVEEALQIKTAKELEDNLNKLQDNMEQLSRIFNSSGNNNG
jgi:uncharacterized small protein (DUF1192 family)